VKCGAIIHCTFTEGGGGQYACKTPNCWGQGSTIFADNNV